MGDNDTAQPSAAYESYDSYIQLTIDAQQAGASLRAVVVARLGAVAAAAVLQHQGVWCNGRRVLPVAYTQPLAAGDQLVLHRPPDQQYRHITITAADLCYRDPWLLAVNKQPGWYSTPTPWDVHGNLRVALTAWLHATEPSPPPLHLTHQLDRDTSGVLLCTLDPALNGAMQLLFNTGAVVKHYLCLVGGDPPAASYDVQTGHGRGARGRWRLYRTDEVGMALPNGSRVRFAHTTFVVVQRLAGAAVLLATLHTGRTHQIRLHAAHIGYPLLGDAKYGGQPAWRGQAVPRQMLHAVRMALPHPVTAQPTVLLAPPPPDMQAVLGGAGAAWQTWLPH